MPDSKQARRDRTAAHSALVAATRRELGREPGLALYLNAKGRPRLIGGTVVYTASPALGKGTSDLVGMLAPNGRWFCLEAKTGEATLTDEQELFRDLVRRMGGFFAEFHSVDEAKACLARARAGACE